MWRLPGRPHAGDDLGVLGGPCGDRIGQLLDLDKPGHCEVVTPFPRGFSIVG